LGHILLQEEQTEDAIAILGPNVKEWSEAPSSYASLGDAYRAAGLEAAKRQYQRGLSKSVSS